MWFKRHVLCKSIEKNRTHKGPKVLKKIRHMKVQVQKEKNDEHMKAHVEKGDSHVLEIKLMRDITHIKEYSIVLSSYPHTCTS
jgi:hypothetical protein